MAISGGLAHVQDMMAACVLGLASPADPKELVLGIVINKQWQKAASGFGFDK